MRASGTSGALRVGYQWAADLGAWEMAPDRAVPKAYALRSTIIQRHAYWITQEPLDLALTFGATEWLWRGVAVMTDGDEITVILAEKPIVCERASVVR